MPPVLEDGVPAHLRRSIDAALLGKRDVYKPAARKQLACLPIQLTPAELLTTSGHHAALLAGLTDTQASPRQPAGSPTAIGAAGHALAPHEHAPSVSSPTSSPLGRQAPGPPSLEELLACPASGPGVLGAARAVGSTWAAAQEREWYRGQLALRPERVTVEAERLLQSAIGPLGLDPAVWRKLPEKVEAVARRNVMRQEAKELHRLRLEEWNPHVIAASAAAAVRTALAEARAGGSLVSGDDGGSDAMQGRPDYGAAGDGLQYEGRGGDGDGGGEAWGQGKGGGGGGNEAGAAAMGAQRSVVSRALSAASRSTRHPAGSHTPRYMETNLERSRLRKALGRLVAKHAAEAGGDAAFQTESAPASPAGGTPGGWTPFVSDGGVAASAAVAGDGTAGSHGLRRRRSSGGGGAAANSEASRPTPRSNASVMRARREAEREARWEEQARTLAARVVGFLDLQSPVKGARQARAAAEALAAYRDGGERVASAPTARRAASASRATRGSAGAAGAATASNATAASSIAAGGGGGLRRGPGAISRPPSVCGAGESPGSPTGAAGAGQGGALAGRGGRQASFSGRAVEWVTAPRQQAEAREEELSPEEAATAERLVSAYEAACRRLGQHVEPGVGPALRRSFVPGRGDEGRTLELVALALTSREAAAALAEVLPKCEHIEGVAFERCALSADALSVVLPALWGLKLRRLATTNTDFPPASWPWLQRALGRPTRWGSEAGWWCSMRCLALTGNALADQGLCALVEVLVEMPRLEALVLRQCGLSDLSAPQLERILDVCGGGGERGGGGGPDGAASGGGAGGPAAAVAASKGRYRGLGLSVGLRALGDGSGRSGGGGGGGGGSGRGLRELDLGYNNLGQRAVGALALALPKARRLQRLSLAWNSVGGGVAALAYTVLRLGPRGCGLTSLDLAGTDLVAPDLFALASMLRAHPHVSVRHLNLSYNNLVGVAAQCLLRHVNRLMQPQPAAAAEAAAAAGTSPAPAAAPPTATAAAATGIRLSERSVSRSASPNREAAARSAGGGGAAATAATAGGVRGSAALESISVSRPLVPILKVHGAAAQAAVAGGGGGGGGGAVGGSGGRADGGPVKRLTINPTPQPSIAQPEAPPSHRVSTATGANQSSSVSPLHSLAPPPLRTGTSSGDGAVLPPPSVTGSFGRRPHSGGAATAAAAGATSASFSVLLQHNPHHRRQQQQPQQQEMVVLTTDCEIVPSLPHGVSPRVHPDGRSLFEEEESRGYLELERERERERNRRAASPDRADRIGGGGAASPPPGAARPGGAAAGTATGTAPPPPAAAAEGLDAVTAAAGAHAYHAVSLDLTVDLPDRATAKLLLEHEMEARRHGHRSVFHGLKWRGKVYKRNGCEVAPLDVMFSGWTHNLPYDGVLELVVQVLPPQLCPWLANPRLLCNARGA